MLNRLQRLGVDLGKASEAAKAWGNGEGDDLAVRDLHSLSKQNLTRQ